MLSLSRRAGVLHSRCRLTEFPVRFVDGYNPVAPCDRPQSLECHRLLFSDGVYAPVGTAVHSASLGMHVNAGVNASLLQPCVVNADEGHSQASSVWSTPRNCFWPLDIADTRACASGGDMTYRCQPGRWCGSNYDAFGNVRFKSLAVVRSATFVADRFFGYAGFDNIGYAFSTVFQCITLEGWTDVMYMVSVRCGESETSMEAMLIPSSL